MTGYTAPAALADVYEKLARAQARREELDTEIARLSGAEYYRVESEAREDNWTTLRVRLIQEPPRALGAIFAESALPLRAALDYLANELAVLNGAERRTSFPIFRSPGDYQLQRRRLLRGVAEEHKNVIEQMQPYREDPPDDHPLAQLAALTNADKHVGLLPTFVRPREHRVDLDFASPVDDFETLVPESAPVQDGDPLLSVRSRPPTQIRLKGRATLDVAFGDSLYTREHLEVIGAHVLWILDVFAPAWNHPRQLPDEWGAVRVGGLGPWQGHAVVRGTDADGQTIERQGPLSGTTFTPRDVLDASGR